MGELKTKASRPVSTRKLSCCPFSFTLNATWMVVGGWPIRPKCAENAFPAPSPPHGTETEQQAFRACGAGGPVSPPTRRWGLSGDGQTEEDAPRRRRAQAPWG